MVIRANFGTQRRSRCRWRPDWRIEDAPLLFVDLETTGLHPERGQRITEIAIIDRGGTRLHLQLSEPSDEETALAQVRRNIEGLITVGHNITFDLRFLAERFERLRLSMPTVGFIDTLGLARRYSVEFDEDLSLEYVARSLNLDVPEDLHCALPDAQLARDVFFTLVEDEGLETLEDVNIRRLQLHGG